MICKKVSAVLIQSTTPITNGFKRAKLSVASYATDHTNRHSISFLTSGLHYFKFLQQISNHKRRRWSIQSGFRLCDLPTSLCAEEG